MITKIIDKMKVTLNEKMIDLNKIDITSLTLAYTFIGLKSTFGVWFVLIVFFPKQTTLWTSQNPLIKLGRLQFGQKNINKILITSFISMLNGILLILFLNKFKKSLDNIIDKTLLFILLGIDSFKYTIIIVLCNQALSLINQNDILFSAIIFVNLFFIYLWNIILRNFYFSMSYGTNNYMSRFHSVHQSLIELVTIIATVIFSIMGFDNLTQSSKIIFNIVLFISRILTINYCLLKWHFTNSHMQNYYAFLVICQTVAAGFVLILQLSRQPLLGANFYICVYTTTAFFFYGWKRYFTWFQQDLYFTQGKDIKSRQKVPMYFKVLYDISGQGDKKTDNTLVLSSIRKQHQIKCHKKQCYCKYDQNLAFIKQYILQQVNDLRINFKNDNDVLIQELYFRFYVFKTYPDINTKLQKIKMNNNLGFISNFSCLKLKHQVIEWIQDKNRSHSTIDVQTPLKLQQVIKQMERIIKKDIQKKSKKWKYLSRGLCRTQQLEQDTQCQINYMKQMSSIHIQWMQKLKRSSQFNIILLFYYKKISFLNVNIDKVQKNLRDYLKKIKQQELSSSKEFAKCLFHKRSCIIESHVDEQNMGIISRSSKNVYDLFGYQQNKIIGICMNKLMPNFMGVEHQKILSDWVKTGTWRTIGKLKQIFCIHKQEFCFSALIYLKMISNQKGLFFIAVIFKKNESDFLIVNENLQIQGIGRKFMHCIGQNCRKIPIQLLVDNFPVNQISKSFEYKSFVRSFRSLKGNQQKIEQYIEQKHRYSHTIEDQKSIIMRYRQKLENSQNLQKWQIRFDAKVYQMRQIFFYVILLNYAKLQKTSIRSSTRTLQQEKYENVIIGHGRINQDQDCQLTSSGHSSNSTIGQKHAQFYEQKNSSMASFTERESFTLTKLLTVFYEFLINPKKIQDKRITTLNISTLLQTLFLATIISVAFIVYMSGLNQINQYIEANAQINQNMQRVILMYNKVISLYEYKNQQVIGKILNGVEYDSYEYYDVTRQHLKRIQSNKSAYNSIHLYKYLRQPMYWIYHKNQKPFELDLLQFLQLYYYITSSISLDVQYDQSLDILQQRRYQLDSIKQNFPIIKQITINISQQFANLTHSSRSDIIFIAWTIMACFFFITFIFFIYTYNYHSFRFTQKYQCLQIYKTIPPNFIQRIKDYYTSFYNQLLSVSTSNKLETHFENLNKYDLILEDCQQSVHANRIKFLGKDKFTGWISSLVIFLAVNTVNILITYEIITFIQPLDIFMNDINKIMDAQNKVLQSYLDIKAAYLLYPQPRVDNFLIDDLLKYMTQNQVLFNQMVTFQSQTLTTYDSTFYDDFYKILINNVCDQIKDMIAQDHYSQCMAISMTSVIQQGIITYMNNFQRKLRSVIQDLKLNVDMRFETQGKSYFINRGFTDVDITMSYNIKIFRKLIERILKGYRMGIDYVTKINVIVLILLITPQIIGLVMWFHLAIRQKQKLSFLYGSMLMIPPNVVRQVKNMPRLARKILQFEQSNI